MLQSTDPQDQPDTSILEHALRTASARLELLSDDLEALDDFVLRPGCAPHVHKRRAEIKSQLFDARDAHRTAYRLFTGTAMLDHEFAPDMFARLVNRGRLPAREAPTTPRASTPTVQRTGTRARGAGRPAARPTVKAARGGDSGDDGPGEPADPPAAPDRTTGTRPNFLVRLARLTRALLPTRGGRS